MINEIEASQLSDIEFKTMVVRKLDELSENYQKLQGNYEEMIANYMNRKKEIETINKSQEMKNTISKLKNTVEGINSRIDGAEDQISELEDKVEKDSPKEQEKEKRLRKKKEGLRELQDNVKRNNTYIIGISEGEGEEEEQGIESLFEKVTMENFPNLMREIATQIKETQRLPIKRNPKRSTIRHIIINGKIPRQREDLKSTKGETGSNIQRSPDKSSS